MRIFDSALASHSNLTSTHSFPHTLGSSHLGCSFQHLEPDCFIHPCSGCFLTEAYQSFSCLSVFKHITIFISCRKLTTIWNHLSCQLTASPPGLLWLISSPGCPNIVLDTSQARHLLNEWTLRTRREHEGDASPGHLSTGQRQAQCCGGHTTCWGTVKRT